MLVLIGNVVTVSMLHDTAHDDAVQLSTGDTGWRDGSVISSIILLSGFGRWESCFPSACLLILPLSHVREGLYMSVGIGVMVVANTLTMWSQSHLGQMPCVIELF